MNQIKEISKRVKNLMELMPRLRDSDKHLIAAIHREDMFNVGVVSSSASYKDFENLFLYGKITSPDSITRARRIIEQDCPELRGTTYVPRQKKSGRVIVK